MTQVLASPSTLPADPAAVRVDAASKSFGDRVILDALDLRIDGNEFVALLGKSGSGKTTLLRILAGLESFQSGTVEVPEARSVVFQDPRLIPSMKVWRNVVFGLRGKAASRSAATTALTEVGLAERADAWPGTLSGGEAQRVALARALVRQPGLLLLDEPFAALDALTRLRMHALVRRLCAAHEPAVLLVTHDVDEAILLADRVLVLVDGRVSIDVATGPDRPQRGTARFHELRALLLAELGLAADLEAGAAPAAGPEP